MLPDTGDPVASGSYKVVWTLFFVPRITVINKLAVNLPQQEIALHNCISTVCMVAMP
jgi:hypothetical protein